MPNKIEYPYLAYSQLTKRVYIVISGKQKIDVTTQYDFIVKEREKFTTNNTNSIPTHPVSTETRLS